METIGARRRSGAIVPQGRFFKVSLGMSEERGRMVSVAVDHALLTDLKHQAEQVAQGRGHRLSPFTYARHDPLRYLSFCTGCGGLAVLDVAPGGPTVIQRIRGYALEADCPCVGGARAASAAIQTAGMEARPRSG